MKRLLLLTTCIWVSQVVIGQNISEETTLEKFYISNDNGKKYFLGVDENEKVISKFEMSNQAIRSIKVNNDVTRTVKEVDGNSVKFESQSLACLVWKTNPMYWQLVAGINVAKGNGQIRDEGHCKELARDASSFADLVGIPRVISDSMGDCACEEAF